MTWRVNHKASGIKSTYKMLNIECCILTKFFDHSPPDHLLYFSLSGQRVHLCIFAGHMWHWHSYTSTVTGHLSMSYDHMSPCISCSEQFAIMSKKKKGKKIVLEKKKTMHSALHIMQHIVLHLCTLLFSSTKISIYAKSRYFQVCVFNMHRLKQL